MFDAEPLDAVVIGAGFAGLYMVYRLREQGFSVHGFERGDGVGGTWYWNRYPGARCDSEIMYYSFSFLPDLEQEWPLNERYPGQPEILRYLEHVADRLDLRKDFTFGARVTAVEYDEAASLWTLRTAAGAHRRRPGTSSPRSAACPPRTSPSSPARTASRGLSLHTGNWPREPVDFTGKRVGVIGTGASGIQAIPVIAEQAGAPDRVPAHRAVHHPGRERAARSSSSSTLWKAELPGMAAPGTALHRRDSPTRAASRPRSRCPRTSAGRSSRPRGARAGSRSCSAPSRDMVLERGGQQDRGRLRPVQDRRDRPRPGGRGDAQAVGLPDRHQAAAARHELLRDVQPAERDPGRPAADADRGDHPDGHQDQRRRITTWT